MDHSKAKALRSFVPLVLALTAAAAGCQVPSEPSAERGALVSASGATSAPPALPVPSSLLDQIHTANRGLLRGQRADGLPTIEGTEMDPLITEARRYYDTIRIPDLAARKPGSPEATAPATFEDWKQALGFEPQRPDEDRAAFRKRTGVVVYYNRNELGLGRELGCVRFTEVDRHGAKPSRGIACFVTNYGRGFGEGKPSLDMAVRGDEPRNTVCIIYRPALGMGYEIQFYVFGPTGHRQEWAQLDTLGPRPHPLVCMNCHGGEYDAERHLAVNAHFLPLDPSLVDFTGDSGPELTRAGQEERIRAVNALSTETPLTPAQRDMLGGLYAGRVQTAGQPATEHWVPAAWSATPEDHDFYDAVVKPYCATCHLAAQASPDGRTLWSYKVFQTPAAFNAASLIDYICGDFSMPNAQATARAFWGGARAVRVGGLGFPSAADAFLAHEGVDRARCPNLQSMSRCDRGTDPDRLCGDSANGITCDRQTGRCGPGRTAPLVF